MNGFTGQFSIGHSGFMPSVVTPAASLLYYGTYHVFGDVDFHGGLLSGRPVRRTSRPWFDRG